MGRANASPARLIIRKIAAQAAVFGAFIFTRDMGHDFVLDLEEFLVPIWLQFIDIQAQMIVESQFDRAGNAEVRAQVAQALFVVAALVALEAAFVELRQQVVDVEASNSRAAKTTMVAPALRATSRNIW
jgi:hypothetical protein